MNVLGLIAFLTLRAARRFARHSNAAHEFLVFAGFDETRLLPRQRLLRTLEPVFQSRVEPDDSRVKSVSGLR